MSEPITDAEMTDLYSWLEWAAAADGRTLGQKSLAKHRDTVAAMRAEIDRLREQIGWFRGQFRSIGRMATDAGKAWL